MKTIVIITQQSMWHQAQEAGRYARSTIDSTLEEVGFIHCTFPHQTMEVLPRFRDRQEVMLLLVDAEKVTVPIKYEAAISGRSGIFPHIYGALNVSAVYETVMLNKNERGDFVVPAQLVCNAS